MSYSIERRSLNNDASCAATCHDPNARQRGVVAEEANIILTNPDMLHASVLPGHKRFRRILGNLSHVVVDEVSLG
ncbi:unnamed protein product [Hapterophycus canaliculatus]